MFATRDNIWLTIIYTNNLLICGIWQSHIYQEYFQAEIARYEEIFYAIHIFAFSTRIPKTNWYLYTEVHNFIWLKNQILMCSAKQHNTYLNVKIFFKSMITFDEYMYLCVILVMIHLLLGTLRKTQKYSAWAKPFGYYFFFLIS